jgi:hypothetical protein
MKTYWGAVWGGGCLENPETTKNREKLKNFEKPGK